MTTISFEPIVLINVFTVAPAKQAALIALLNQATEEVMRHLPGFVSANIHRGLEGDKVANYAQWRSEADFVAMQADPAAQVHMQQAAALCESFAASLYRLQQSHV